MSSGCKVTAVADRCFKIPERHFLKRKWSGSNTAIKLSPLIAEKLPANKKVACYKYKILILSLLYFIRRQKK